MVSSTIIFLYYVGLILLAFVVILFMAKFSIKTKELHDVINNEYVKEIERIRASGCGDNIRNKENNKLFKDNAIQHVTRIENELKKIEDNYINVIGWILLFIFGIAVYSMKENSKVITGKIDSYIITKQEEASAVNDYTTINLGGYPPIDYCQVHHRNNKECVKQLSTPPSDSNYINKE